MGGAGGPEPPSTPPADPPVRKERTLAINSSTVFVVTLLIQAVGYIPSYFLSGGLAHDSAAGEALWGTIQLFLLLSSSISTFGDLRIGQAFTFFVSRGDSPKRASSTYFLVRMTLVLMGGILLFALGPSLGFSTASTAEIFAVWLGLPILWSASVVYQNLWTSLGDAARSQYPLLVESVVRTAALTYVAIGFLNAPGHGLADPTGSLWMMTAAYVAGAAASAAVSLPSILHYRGPIRLPELSRMFRWSWPLMGSMTLQYLTGNLISFLVLYYLHLTQFNLFNAANAFRTLALALPAAIAIPLFPHISALHKSEAFPVIRSKIWQTLRYTTMLMVPGVISLVVYRVNILYMFYHGSNYIQAGPALAILALSAAPAALSQIIGTALTSMGRNRLEFYITTLQVGCMSVVGAVLLAAPSPALATLGLTGLNGAAIAVLVSSVAALLLNTYFLSRLVGVHFQFASMATITLSAAAAFFAVSRLNSILPVNRYYQLAAGVILGFGVYLVVLALVGELAKEDVRTVCASMGLPETLGNFVARFCWRVNARPVNPLPARGGSALVPLEAHWTDPDDPAGPITPPTRLQ